MPDARHHARLADEPLAIQWTPKFLRNFAGAMLHSPGVFDKGQKAFFSITPPRVDEKRTVQSVPEMPLSLTLKMTDFCSLPASRSIVIVGRWF